MFRDTRQLEKLTLLSRDDKDTVIQVNEEYTLDNTSQDVMNILSSMLAYKKNLAHLRQGSKKLNALVENTPAGKRSREANDLDPSLIIQLIKADAFFGVLFGVSFAGGGVGSYVALCHFLDWSSYFFAPLIPMVTLFGGGAAVGAGVGGLAYWGSSVAKHTLFQNKEKQKSIREELKHPISEFKNRI